MSGKGRIEVGAEAGVDHRFYAIEDDLTVLLFFAPAEGSEAGRRRPAGVNPDNFLFA